MANESITYFGKPAHVACDENCTKAWGIHNRPKVQLSENQDDYEWLADGELPRTLLDAYLNQIAGRPRAVTLLFLGAFADYLDRECPAVESLICQCETPIYAADNADAKFCVRCQKPQSILIRGK